MRPLQSYRFWQIKPHVGLFQVADALEDAFVGLFIPKDGLKHDICLERLKKFWATVPVVSLIS